ncbi:MAG: methyltransferase domain-containing protein [Verrucomicrobia bacterium]|nr:methyltransferase domain-containing protein [Verrucomicrobiota bacterium]
MLRRVTAELLDELPAADPRAVHSRADLRRVNAWMAHKSIMLRSLHRASVTCAPRRLVELGTGDGSFLLGLARHLPAHPDGTDAWLVDQQELLAAAPLAEFARLGWRVRTVKADVFDWLEQADAPRADVMLANLFLHHFDEARLRHLLRLAAACCDVFVACEPRRSPLAMAGAHMLWAIGCNGVTRHDAVVSVRAGFAGHELTSLWPQDGWQVEEAPAGLFTHCFAARRIGPR